MPPFSISPLSARLPFSRAIRRSTTTATATTTTTTIICARCQWRRSFAASAPLASGHSKWSKIKHDKKAADQKKNDQRATFARQLTFYSKLAGPDPNMNPQLASVVAAAKKAGVPKANIDQAIARGQGKSETGASLESATLEVMLAPSVAMVVDIESDNKQRSIKDLRSLVKKHGGTVTPTAFLFTRQGRIVLEVPAEEKEKDFDFDDVMMRALDAGAEDVERDAEGNVVVWTPPNMTHQVAQDLGKTLNLSILSSDILYSCTSDKVKLDDPDEVAVLAKLLAAVNEYPDVQAVYINAERGDVSEEAWGAVEEALNS